MVTQDQVDRAWKALVKTPRFEGYERLGQVKGLSAYIKDVEFLEDDEAKALGEALTSKTYSDVSAEAEKIIKDYADLWTKISAVEGLNGDLSSWIAFLVPASEGEVLATIKLQAAQVAITVGEASSCAGHGIILINVNDVRMEGKKPVTFSVCHEFGHIVDGALTTNHLPYLQTIVPGYKGNELAVAHDKEFFGDAFATRLLKATGWDPTDIQAAAKTLLGGTSVSPTHPSGTDRISRITAILQEKI